MSNLYAAKVKKASKTKVLFTTSGLKPFGVGTIIKIVDGGEEIGRATVTKTGKRLAVAKVFKGKGLILKGYSVVILLRKKRGSVRQKQLKKKRKRSHRKKDNKSLVARKFAILGGANIQTVGAMAGGQKTDPTTGFGSYLGLKGEFSYKIGQVGVSIGLDLNFGPGAAEMPPQSFSEESFKADGVFSDIYIGGHYFLDKFGLHNYYLTAIFIPLSGHKLSKDLEVINFQNVYGGTGLGLGAGKEWIFGKWLVQANGLVKNYSFTTLTSNQKEEPTSVAITQSVLSLSIMGGYHF